MTNDTTIQNMINVLYGEQRHFTPTQEILDKYEWVHRVVVNTIADNHEKGVMTTQFFDRVVSNESAAFSYNQHTKTISAVLMSPDLLIVPIGAKAGQAIMNIVESQLANTMKRAVKSPGTNIRFQYSINLVEDRNNKDEELVVLIYGYSYEAKTIECGNCKTSFVKTREWSKFCSDKCRQAAYRNKI